MSEYIGRQKTIDFIKSEQCKQCSNIGLCGKCAVLVAIDLIKTAPTADVAPVVHGHWIYGEDESGQDGYSCSECDFFVPWYYKYYEQGLHFIKDYHLCPQCGAKMDESEESNDV